MITSFDEPPEAVGPLHQQALDIIASSTGDRSEEEKLGALFDQATGEEAEMIGWEIEGWAVMHNEARIAADDLSWVTTEPSLRHYPASHST